MYPLRQVPTQEGYNKLEPQWESGVYLGINDSSQELIVGTANGVIKSPEFRHKGSDAERWNFDEVNSIQGLPWQPDPRTAGMDVKPRVFMPMEVPVTDDGGVDAKPIVARGVAVKKAEYLAMGATPGCYGCKAILRGDAHHKPRSPLCRERVLKWLREQDDVRVQSA